MQVKIDYTSTRDAEKTTKTYSEVLLQGLAPDGGLYIPSYYPQIDIDDLKNLAGKPYIDIFSFIKGLFIGTDIPSDAQKALAVKAFSHDKFPSSQGGEIAPVVKVTSNFYVQQLSLGPTAAFKDMALQPLGQDMQYVLAKLGKKLNLLGATSGDTGSAAEAAVKGLSNIKLFMLSPEEGMSPFQKAQMGSLTGDNIFNISIPGRFDDCQNLVKMIKNDPAFANLGAVNSINWGRIASQVPYYVSGYLQVVGNDLGRPVDFVVPTGNFGNILAGYIAREIGVPIRKLIVATNENNVVHKLVQTGIYSRPCSAVITSSPSMDITVASNYERLAYDLLGRDARKTTDYMKTFEETGSVAFEKFGLANTILKDIGFDSGCSVQKDRLESIQWTYDRNGQVIDPHTADAVTVAREKQSKGVPIVCMSTALPVKFESTIMNALGFIPPRESRFIGIENVGSSGFESIGNDINKVKAFIKSNVGKELT